MVKIPFFPCEPFHCNFRANFGALLAMRVCYGWIGLMLLTFNLKGQHVDSAVFSLPEIPIIEKKWEAGAMGQELYALDSIQQTIFSNQKVADWLQMEGLFYLKSYGVGQLNTLSYRGNTANQNQILWNGVPIQSPFNATPDFAQVAVQQGEISILRGSNPALWGAGSGASILLKPAWNSPVRLQIQEQLGSFGLHQQSLFYQPTLKNHFAQVQAYRLTAINNFPYIHYEKPGHPKQFLEHAKTQHYGLQFHYKTFIRQHILSLHAWKHYAQTQIPPVLTADTSAQNQTDDNLRLQVAYQIPLPKLTIGIHQTYLNDFLYYEDSIANIFSSYRSNQWFSDLYLQYPTKKNFFQVQLQNHWIFPWAENSLVLPKVWQRHSLTALYYTSFKRWKSSLTYRQELIQNQWIMPILHVGIEGYSRTPFFVKGSFGNTYRYPSLNDYYWQVGGNPNLKPEKGLQYEATLGWKKPFLELHTTYYAGHYYDLIVWLPEGSIWKAQNLQQTYTQGIEFVSQWKKEWRQHQWQLHLAGFYGKSILNQERFPGDAAYRKQLLYQPRYRWSARFHWSYRAFSLHYHHLWNGYVYYTTDNSEWLPDYHLANLTLQYLYKLSKHEIHLDLQIKNLWNVEYQSVKNRPMPKRNFMVGVVWKWGK